MLIGWDNKADAAALSASSEQASLPGSNVQQPHLSRKWYTATGVKSAALTLDLGASLSCGMLAVLGTNFTSAATLRLRASDADSTAVAGDKLDTGTVSANVKDGYGVIYKSFAAVAARYWRADLADASVPDNLRVGRLFLGPKWAPAVGMDYGWAPIVDDPSKMVESYGGQSHPEILPQRRGLQFTLSWMTEAEAYDNAHVLARACGVVKDMLAIPLETGSRISEQAVWGMMTALAPIFHKYSQIWIQKFEIKERL